MGDQKEIKDLSKTNQSKQEFENQFSDIKKPCMELFPG